MTTRPRLLAPWRRSFQWTTTLVWLAVPFFRVRGKSLLRLDVPTLTLHAGGETFSIEEFYLVLLLVLVLIILFALTTLVLGRAWCGWACPQTILSDLTEWFAGRIKVAASAGTHWRRLLLHLFCLGTALLVGVSLVLYFVSPYDFFPQVFSGNLPTEILIALAVVAAAVYLDLAFVRRLLCREFCPYGRFQAALVEPGSLTLRVPPQEAPRCIDCGACVRACPTGIDIRRGEQIECISCGRCLDACREVMARRNQAGIIRYTFDPHILWTPRTLLLVLVLAALAAGVFTAPQGSLKLARTAAAGRRLPDGTQVTFFTAFVANHTGSDDSFALAARLENGSPLEIRGPAATMPLAAGERRRLEFALLSPAPHPGSPLTVQFSLTDDRGQVVATGRAFITATED